MDVVYVITTIIVNTNTNVFLKVTVHGGATRGRVKDTRRRTGGVITSTVGATRTEGGRMILRNGSRIRHFEGRDRGRVSSQHGRIRHRREEVRRGRRALSGGLSGVRHGRRGIGGGLHSTSTGLRRIRALGGDRFRVLRGVSNCATRRTGDCLLSRLRGRLTRRGSIGVVRCARRLGRRTSSGTEGVVSLTVRQLTTRRISRTAVSIIPLPGSRVGNEVVNERNHGVETVRALANISLVVSSAPRTVALSYFRPMEERVTEVTLRGLVTSNEVRPTEVRRVIRGTEERIRSRVGHANRETILSTNIRGVRPRLIGLLNELHCHADCNRGMLSRSLRISCVTNVVTDRLNLSPAVTGHTNLLRSVNGSVSRRIRKARVRVNISLTGGCGRDSTIVRTVRTRRNSIRTEAVITYLMRTTSTVSTTEPNTEERGIRGCVGQLRGLRRITSSFSNIRHAFTVRTNHRIEIVIGPRVMGSRHVVPLTESVYGGVRRRLRCPKRVGIGVVHRDETSSFTGWGVLVLAAISEAVLAMIFVL